MSSYFRLQLVHLSLFMPCYLSSYSVSSSRFSDPNMALRVRVPALMFFRGAKKKKDTIRIRIFLEDLSSFLFIKGFSVAVCDGISFFFLMLLISCSSTKLRRCPSTGFVLEGF